MSYAVPRHVMNSQPDMTRAENHEKVVIDVYTIDGTFVEQVNRTVMTNDGKQYITYDKVQHQVKNLKKIEGDTYRLKLPARRAK